MDHDVDVAVWQRGILLGEEEQEIGPACDLFEASILVFSGLLQALAADPVHFDSESYGRLRDEFLKFYMWNESFSTRTGGLDHVLACSKNLKGTVLGLMVQWVRTVSKVPEIMSDFDWPSAFLNSTKLQILTGKVEQISKAAMSDVKSEHSFADCLDLEDSSDSASDIESSLSEYTFDDIIEDLSTYMESLADLSPSLDHPATDHVLIDDVNTSLIDEFSTVSEPARPFVSIIRDRFPSLDVRIVKKLGEASWQRRERLRIKLASAPEMGESFANSNNDSRIGDSTVDLGQQVIDDQQTIVSTIRSSISLARTFQSVTIESRFSEPSIFDNMSVSTPAARRVRSAESITSFATSVAVGMDHGQRKVPNLPEEHVYGSTFQCKICGEILAGIRHRADWKKHVYNDLEPYICLFSDCDLKLHTFQSRREWQNHEFQVHRVIAEWRCNLCNETFEMPEHFRGHINVSHGNDIAMTQVEDFISISKRVVPCKIENEVCPFCLAAPSQTQGGFASHVGRHQEEISLAALPRLEHNLDDENIADGNGYDDNDCEDNGDHDSKTKGSDDVETEAEERNASSSTMLRLSSQQRLQRQNNEYISPAHSSDTIHWPYTTQMSPRPDRERKSPVQDSDQSRAADAGPWSQSRSQQHSPIANELDASPTSTLGYRQWSSRHDAEEDMPQSHEINRDYTPNIQPGPQSFATNTRRSSFSFRTPDDVSRAQEILLRDKDAKMEKRSSLRRLVMPKSKRTTFSQREMFRAIQSVITGDEKAGPGVVEELLGKFVKGGGDINFVPQQIKPLGIALKKRQEERSGLLEKAATCGDVEIFQLLSKYSDKTAKNNSLEIALHNRNATTGRNTARDDQMISILVSDGADVYKTISDATAAGEENLLRILLEGNPPIPALSEALPIAVTNRDTLLRRRLSQMLLRKGADVNSSGGESIFQAIRLFDMVLLNILLERRPHVLSLSRAFAAALSYSDYNYRFEACQKLIDAGATGEQVNKGLAIAMTAEHQNIDFLRLILRSASVDFENGHALCQAVTNNYQEHLKLMLASRPNEQSFDNAIEAALMLTNARDQLECCDLLVRAGPPRDSCSKALVVAVTSQKYELCRVFLEARASVDYNRGASITVAARSENIGILELLVGGEFRQPNNASLVAAFEFCLLSALPSPKKMKMIRLILDAGLQGPALDVALVNATKKGQEGMAMCELFLKYGASVNAQGGEALDFCTSSGNTILLEKLLQSAHRPSSDILSRIFQSSLKLDQRIRPRAMEMILKAGMPINDQVAAALDALVQERRPDMQAIEVLLSFHASVHYEGHRPLVTAAKSLNKPLLILLLEESRDTSASSKVFEALLQEDYFWGKREAFPILTLLIENGAEGIAVDEALIKAVQDGQPSARHFEVALLQHANIDHKDGTALQVATERGDLALVRRMLAMKPAAESISMAFPYALASKLPESICLAVIEAFVEIASEDLYSEYMHPEILEPPVFLCIKWYPNSLKVLEATLNAGFHVDQAMVSDSGKFTALYWALTGGKEVGDHIVEFLISRCANLYNHPEPLLHLAIKNGRHSIVQALLKAGADVDLADETCVSPLSLATQKNDIASMEAVLAAKALSNDGSLHDAARMVNANAIKLLLNNGHDPNFPCPRFEGRPPLFELCYQAPTYLLETQLTTPQKEKMTKEAIETLIKGGALTKDRLLQAGNRSVLLHALDSANPHMMTKAFLECGQFKYINRDFNLFMDGRYIYSPTMYVEKGKSRGDNSQPQSLIKLLKDFRAEDRYWKIDGPQPLDMINPPAHIVKAEEERKEAERRKREEEEEIRREVDKQQRELAAARRKLALEQEAEQAKLDRENRAFQLRQAHETKVHAASITKENDRLRIQEARNAHALKQAASMSQLRNDEAEARQRMRMKLIGEKNMAAQSQEALYLAYNKTMEDAIAHSEGTADGPSSTPSALNLSRAARLRIDGAFPRRIEEIDE